MQLSKVFFVFIWENVVIAPVSNANSDDRIIAPNGSMNGMICQPLDPSDLNHFVSVFSLFSSVRLRL